MNKLDMKNFQIILEDDIKRKLFELIPENSSQKEIQERLNTMSASDREWFFNVFDKSKALIKNQEKYYRINSLLLALMICGAIAFFTFAFLQRNYDHDVVYYIVCTLFVVIEIAVCLLTRYFVKKGDKKLTNEELY